MIDARQLRVRIAGSRLFPAIPIARATLAVDQAAKVVVRHYLGVCVDHAHCPEVYLAGPVELVRIQNAGSAFGAAPGLRLWVVVAALGVVLIPIYGRRIKVVGTLAVLAVGLQLGGGLGNLADWVLDGQATDYLWIRGWADIFNAADVALAVGMLFAVAVLLSQRAGRVSQSGA